MRTARARAPCETEPTRLHLEEECRVRSIDRKMSSCSERSAKKTARQAYSGTLGHSMQTAPMILAVLVGTLTVLVAAGAIYQAIGTWRGRRPSHARLSKSPMSYTRCWMPQVCPGHMFWLGTRSADM